MSDATRHDTTRHDATGSHDETGRDATRLGLAVDVAQAAAILGITPGAVRKRLERGQLAGEKIGGQWRVWLERDATGATGPVSSHDTTTRHDTTVGATVVVSEAARSQLEAIRDEWLRPLVDRIGELEREAGRLQAERDALAARVAELEATPERPIVHAGAANAAADERKQERSPSDSAANAAPTPVPARSWWRLIRERLPF